VILTRRYFLLSAGALSAGCVRRRNVASAPIGAAARLRQPEVGQSWRYARHDLFTGAMVDTQFDRVSAVGQSIEIESQSEGIKYEPIEYPSWGANWLQKYTRSGRPAGRVPSEVQEPWGMVLIDPHWAQLQVYEKPIPLWPMQLRPGWSITVRTNYQIPDRIDALPWELTMHAHQWESIVVPAGHFTALCFTNLINFRFTNISGRNAAQRKETVWFSPEIGRWVVRESSGTFRQDVTEEFNESSYRWELLSWT
jgi:hypothetical protein